MNMPQTHQLQLPEGFDSYRDVDGQPLKVLEPLGHINIAVGSNNSGKSRFMRTLASLPKHEIHITGFDLNPTNRKIQQLLSSLESQLTSRHIISADSLSLENIRKFRDLPTTLHAVTDVYQELRDALKSWGKMGENPHLSSHATVIRTGDPRYPELPENVRKDTNKAIEILNSLPPTSGSPTPKRVYIPILRGLRPLDDQHTDFYGERTRRDYFPTHPTPPEIFTGQKFYEKLIELLLGSNAERKQIVKYQEFISRELFEGREVVLIPSQTHKAVTIKIGKEQEQPVHNLGDGVQSAIILSFLPFVTKEPTSFFIEEPECHMHPGLQRKVLELFDRTRNHRFYLTTHSNHLLDITIDLSATSIFTFQKKINHEEEDDEQTATVTVESVSAGHRSSLEQLGVRNSSVFLVNATIWVEGITDRKYLRALLKSYMAYLASSSSHSFKPEEDVHYCFVEYGGSNITHWSFLDLDQDDRPIQVERLCGQAMVIIDQDGDAKMDRKEALKKKLEDRYFILDAREIENLLPPAIIQEVIESYEKDDSISVPLFDFSRYQHEYIGAFIETHFPESKRKGGYADDSGTIKQKVNFCDRASALLEKFDFAKLPEPTQKVAEKIYKFIREANSL